MLFRLSCLRASLPSSESCIPRKRDRLTTVIIPGINKVAEQ